MKKTFLLSVCLLLAGGLYAQNQEAESPVFLLGGFDASTVSALKSTPKEGSEDLIPWNHPDSIVCIKAAGTYGMYVYHYNDRGNTIQQDAFQYISSNTWMPTQQVLSSYNQWDLVDTTTSYFYQQDGYVPNARKISSYDKRGRRVSLLNQTWNNQAQAWTSTERFTYTYNKNNQLETSLEEQPDTRVFGDEAWIKYMKTDYGYDQKGREIRFEMTFWTGSDWFPFRGIYRTYENDLLTWELGRIYNEMTGVYMDTYRYEYSYNEQGNKTNEWIFYTDTTGKWDTTVHHAYFYEEGFQTEELTRIFDQGLGRLENTTREFYFYNKEGIKDSVTHEEWESDGGWWHTASLRYFFNEQGVNNGWIYYNLTQENYRTDKYEFDFNEYGDGTRSRCFTLKNDDWKPVDRYDLEVKDRNGNVILRSNNMLLSEITVSYVSGTKTPVPEPDTTDDDTSAIVRLKLLLDAQVDVYPNPVSETLYVDVAGEGVYEVSLSTPAGTVVERFRMTAGRKTLNVGAYKGVYVLRVCQDGASITKKVIII